MIRFGYVMATCFAAVGVALSAFIPTQLKFVWNSSASTPIGLYTIDPVARLEVADLVAIDAPELLATFLAERGYLPRGVPLLKRVLALPGQEVCRNGRTISVDGIDMAEALDHDRLGRILPSWQGCHIIATGEVFLMNWQVRDSLDGRYFGPMPASSIIGRATPLYTDEEGDCQFEWRAPKR